MRNYFQNGLNRYPGPLFAGFTNLWHWLDVQSSQHHHHLIQLHRQHGSIVRIGPNKLSISSPDYVPRIYGPFKGFSKSDMYDAFATYKDGKITHSSLSAQDPALALRHRKSIATAYSVNAVAVYEPVVDQMITKLISRLREISQEPGEGPPDMALWSRLFAHDVILHLTFSNTLGFMDAGSDVGGFIAGLDGNLDLVSLTAHWWKLNPIVSFFKKYSHMFVPWALQRIQKRIAERQYKYGSTTRPKESTTDYLDTFLNAARSPNELSGYDFTLLMDWTLVNVMAGAETTAVGLRTVFWFLLKDPSRKEKLIQELHDAKISVPVSWKQSQQLPYLDACIKTTLRHCPVIGLGLERKVPLAGLQMPDGYVLPEGTNVGMNAWVVNRQRNVFGEDPDTFVPKRWLQQNNESAEQYRNRIGQMDRTNMTFGKGARACTGRQVAFLEIYKVVPALVMVFEIEMEAVEKDREWRTVDRWTVRQRGNVDTLTYWAEVEITLIVIVVSLPVLGTAIWRSKMMSRKSKPSTNSSAFGSK
ncbi:MAG: hypothetical protein Q9168_001363 [Polycauliona sp. 1 TL-2023]